MWPAVKSLLRLVVPVLIPLVVRELEKAIAPRPSDPTPGERKTPPPANDTGEQ